MTPPQFQPKVSVSFSVSGGASGVRLHSVIFPSAGPSRPALRVSRGLPVRPVSACSGCPRARLTPTKRVVIPLAFFEGRPPRPLARSSFPFVSLTGSRAWGAGPKINFTFKGETHMANHKPQPVKTLRHGESPGGDLGEPGPEGAFPHRHRQPFLLRRRVEAHGQFHCGRSIDPGEAPRPGSYLDLRKAG